MNWNNKFTTFLTYSNIWVAASVASLTWISQLFFGEINLNYIAFSFLSTLAFYSYARFFEGSTDKETSSPITLWHKKHRLLLVILMVASMIGAAYFAFNLSKISFAILAVSALFGLLYPIPYILGKWSGIRHIAGLKLFVIALIWTTVTAVIPCIDAGMFEFSESWAHILQRFMLITAITIPFDVRDMNTDHPNIDTLPQKLGPKRALSICLILGILIEGSLLLQYFQGALSGYTFIALFVGVEVAITLSYKSYPINKDLYYSFLIEGTPILMFLMVYFFQYF